ncbi:helix-turn-helix domain-containing protein [Streptomyces sp. NPDC001982]|uniref:helix-turn-helix domain-containing protein n=1 Tax=Streptomyces sp. NPDC001982 TaxID=3154405 RepID=UPI00332BD20C
MTLIRFQASAMARCRFALSPLAETLACLIALERNNNEAWIKPWVQAHRPEYVSWRDGDPVRRGILQLTASTKWFPSMFGIVPTDGMNTRLPDELDRIRCWTDDENRADLLQSVGASWLTHDDGWLAATDLSNTAADTIRDGWHRFVEPDWHQRRTLLERDIMRRAGLLAAYGWREATMGMTPASTWAEHDALTFSSQHYDDIVVGEDGLIFVPHTPGCGTWTCEEPPRYALAYPAWGVAAPVGATRHAATVLLGVGRAAVLEALATPATPTQLAELLDVSLGTVSGHLKVLRDAGAIEGARVGRTVRYTQTSRGARFLESLSN